MSTVSSAEDTGGPLSPCDPHARSASTEHVFADSRVIVREDEPTSIISFILSSKSYRDKMRNIAHQQRTRKAGSTTSLPSEALPDTTKTPHAEGLLLDEGADPDDASRNALGTHLNYGEIRQTRVHKYNRVAYEPDCTDFENGTTVFFCRIFFAERFAALRSACGCEDSYLDSLARCLKWDSSGGKSGSAFLKSRGE